MNAGPELDAMVAEKVMGFRWYVPTNPEWKGAIGRILWNSSGSSSFGLWDGDAAIQPFRDWHRDVPRYSSYTVSAWEVVETLGSVAIIKVADGWMVGGINPHGFADAQAEGRLESFVIAETAPLAICWYALARAQGQSLVRAAQEKP